MSFSESFLAETAAIAARLDPESVELLATELAAVRDGGGRLFILGVGGSAANASHAACDFRKAAGFEAYCPSDNVAELTATANDEGPDNIYVTWLRESRLCERDAVLVLSVGGGDQERGVSTSLVAALRLAKRIGTRVFGIVGRDGGFTVTVADLSVIVPTLNPAHVTAHAESFQAVVWHLLVSHPALQRQKGRWETLAGGQ